jgi:DNA-binding MarR family transcriptional regulator
VFFFFSALLNIKTQLIKKLERTGVEAQLSPREKSIITFLSDHPGSKSGTIAERLDIPNPTVKRILKNLVDKNLIEVFGKGPGTNYTIK